MVSISFFFNVRKLVGLLSFFVFFSFGCWGLSGVVEKIK